MQQPQFHVLSETWAGKNENTKKIYSRYISTNLNENQKTIMEFWLDNQVRINVRANQEICKVLMNHKICALQTVPAHH